MLGLLLAVERLELGETIVWLDYENGANRIINRT